MMKLLRTLTLITIGVALAPSALAADFGVRAGRFQDAADEFVGAELLIDIGTININPNLEYWLVDDFTAGTANLDVTFDILRLGSISPYVGAGVGLAYVESDFGGSSTDVVGNLIGGVGFRVAALQPYAQVKYFRFLDENDTAGGARDDVAFTLGLRF